MDRDTFLSSLTHDLPRVKPDKSLSFTPEAQRSQCFFQSGGSPDFDSDNHLITPHVRNHLPSSSAVSESAFLLHSHSGIHILNTVGPTETLSEYSIKSRSRRKTASLR